MSAPVVVTFGEMLLRLSPPPYETFLESPGFTANFGGCEANVGVALARLGVRPAYVTVLPDNPVGDAAMASLREAGVDTSGIVRATGRMGVYFVELGRGERATRVVYDRAGSAFATASAELFRSSPLPQGAAWLHGSGITPALSVEANATMTRALAAARSARVPVSIDLNYRPALWTDKDPKSVGVHVRGADLLIGNARACREMLGVDASDEVTAAPNGAHALARDIAQQFGARRVALTRREMPSEERHLWSASLYDADTGSFAMSRVHDVHVVDRVGGGDAFAAALIACLLRGEPSERAVEYAAAAGALKLAVPGDFATFTHDDITRAVAG
ncbi:MAG TPA: sugar kinase [Gemmatimonadaceae bacterium]|nr:sugar kinase [Gemmatimonadaceae bacterium]